MIDLKREKELALTAQERYDVISFAMEAADDNGFINSFIFERALWVYAAIVLYPERKDELATSAAEDLLETWNTLVADETLADMIEQFPVEIETLSQESELWYEEYQDWAHSVRGILDVVQGFSSDILQTAAGRLTQTAQETGVSQLLETAEDWGMTRTLPTSKPEKEVEEEALFE